ncbi:MAG: ATP-binding protein, partial [Cyanophyceae cyanobacterium]
SPSLLFLPTPLRCRPKAVLAWGLSEKTDEIENIFHKFYRNLNMDPWKQGGTGLGLALVKKGIEQLQGSLKVTSQAGSTTFLMILPRCLPRCAKAVGDPGS